MTKPHFYRTATSHGDVFRANFAGCDLELVLEKDWLQIIDEAGDHETWSREEGSWLFREGSKGQAPTFGWPGEYHTILEAAIADVGDID